jgi:hypothetical protein
MRAKRTPPDLGPIYCCGSWVIVHPQHAQHAQLSTEATFSFMSMSSN